MAHNPGASNSDGINQILDVEPLQVSCPNSTLEGDRKLWTTKWLDKYNFGYIFDISKPQFCIYKRDIVLN